MILIVGATGTLGGLTARRLLEAGKPVRVLARTPAKAEPLRALGAEVVQGDLRDAASLRRAAEGTRQVVAAAHALLGGWGNTSRQVDGDGHRALIDAARQARVEHVVYTSVRGAAPDHPVAFCRTKAEVEAYLRRSGLAYTILRPSAFMEVHAHLLIGKPVLEKGAVVLFGRGDNPRSFVAVEDVARFVVLALEDPALRGQTIEIGGPDNLTNNEVVRLYARLAGRTPRVRHVPLPVLHVVSRLARPLHPGLSQIMRLSINEDTADLAFDASGLQRRYPVPLTRMEDWVRQQVAHAPTPAA